MRNQLVLLLGSNLGNRLKTLQSATRLLEARLGRVKQESLIYESRAWGYEQQGHYLNQVLTLETELSAPQVLEVIQDIESIMGRERFIKWGARTLDVDILFYNDDILERSNLLIPHPLIQFRRFALVPLVEVMPYFIHPQLNQSMQELLRICEDKLDVAIYEQAEEPASSDFVLSSFA